MMQKILPILLIIIFSQISFTQIVVTQPEFPTESDSIVVFFDASQPGAEELLNYTGTLYAHTGVITNLGGTVWQHVVGSWGNNQTQPALTRLGTNLYKLTVGFPRQFYSVTNPAEKIIRLAIVFRSSDGSLQTRPDIFIDLFESGLNLIVQNPEVSVSFGDPQRSPAFVKEGEIVPININAVEIGTEVQSITLYVDGNQVAQSFTSSLVYNFAHNNYTAGPHNCLAVGVDTSGQADSTNFMMFVNPAITYAPLPNGMQPGINYTNITSVTLALFAPYIDFIYVIGDFSDWKVETANFLNKFEVTPDSVIWWITLSASPGNENAFQYLANGNIRTGDPYAEKILDPWNDQFINSTRYPNLKSYPNGKTENLVSIFQTGQTPYNWQVTNFQKPPKEKLVIYELLIRDFIEARTFNALRDTLSYLKSLGVNAIELMPIMEFSGNSSWGYNPVYHTAVDKYYGPANTLKAFIDECHQNGIAVILDMVLNHTENYSPLAMLWWDNNNNRPAANNPYLNPTARHPFNVFNDFNHESNATKYFVDRVNKYWLEEFKFDGFRFDLSKGFTQTFTTDVGVWSNYDQSRINILKRMADKIWQVDTTAYVILEHFAVNSEETVLANYGMMLWGNMNHEYNEATMGYNSNLWGVSHLSRGWSVQNLIGYMESHDEERLMYKNLQFGNSAGNYNIKDLAIALNRIKLAAAFFFTIPGPKMLWQFGELGYDISIDNPCRVCEKPILWSYLQDGRRLNLYKVFQALIKLKNDYEAFSSNNFTMDVGNFIKKVNIYHPQMDVFIIGNFAVTPINPSANFSSTGWWYDYFSGDSINVSNLNQTINLEPGEFHIYTTMKLPTPEPGILLNAELIEDGIVTSYELEQNYPNPFNPSTSIRYSVLEPGKVSLKIFDILGREIKTLVNQEQVNGVYQVEWNGENNFGNQVSSGIYFYRIEAGNYIDTKKMILMK